MLKIHDSTFSSRLLVGTGKFANLSLMQESVVSAEAEIVTVALRRIDKQKLKHNQNQNHDILSFLPPQIQLLPNTSGARNAEEAIRLARLARACCQTPWIKLEVIPDAVYLLPDPIETLKAATILVKEGFVVLPYMNADPILAKHLEEVGCATVMPLGSPIGTNKGLKTLEMLQIIIERSQVPVIIDAGLGRPSDAALAMEIGADAVLINTAIASANNPVFMAQAFKEAVRAGRLAYEIGLPPVMNLAQASSPLTGFLGR